MVKQRIDRKKQQLLREAAEKAAEQEEELTRLRHLAVKAKAEAGARTSTGAQAAAAVLVEVAVMTTLATGLTTAKGPRSELSTRRRAQLGRAPHRPCEGAGGR